jgi:hypothetical protein
LAAGGAAVAIRDESRANDRSATASDVYRSGEWRRLAHRRALNFLRGVALPYLSRGRNFRILQRTIFKLATAIKLGCDSVIKLEAEDGR